VNRVLIAVVGALTLLSTSAAASSWVLPPEASTEVAALIGADRPLSGGQVLTASLDRDHVVVTALSGGDVVTRVTLRHPERSADGAERIGGVTVDRAPGPVDEALLSELLARMRASGAEVHWRQSGAGSPKPAGRAETALRAITRAARLGQRETVRELLGDLPSELSPRQTVRAAARWSWLGEAEKSAALVATLGDTPSPAIAAMIQVLEEPDALLAYLEVAGDPANRCVLSDAADLLSELRHHELAMKLSRQIVEGAPGCVRAWTREIRARLASGDRDGALRRADEAVARFPDDPRVASARADAVAAPPPPTDGVVAEEYATLEIVEALEAVVRRAPSAPGRLADLAETVARLPEADRRAKRLAYRGALARDPEDVVARYVVGHEALAYGDFPRATEVLGPLAEALDDVPEVAVALAVAEFERGDREGALARLDQAAAMTTLDPEVFYERAEVLRDKDFEGARAALETYLAACESVGCSKVDRQGRAGKLVDVLKRCIRENAFECESEHWEHPRKAGKAPTEVPAAPTPAPAAEPPPTTATDRGPDTASAAPEEGSSPALPLAIGGAALLLLLGFALIRRRGR